MLDPDISTADALRLLAARDDDPAGLSRRRFLRLVGLGVGAGALATGLDGLVEADRSWAAGPLGPQDGVLVVVGMYGGNDGLNTVVPLGDADYARYRPASMRIADAAALPLAPGRGLHPALTTLRQLNDQGMLAVVEGVGHPDIDLSHFNAMARWMSATTTGVPSSGWLGRWLDGHTSGSRLYTAATIGSGVPLHVLGSRARATAVDAAAPRFGGRREPADLRLYGVLREMATAWRSPWRAATAGALRDQLDVGARLAPIMPTAAPAGPMVAKLSAAARLINADLGFRVLDASWGDFDSHAGQPVMHGQRMAELDAGIRAFYSTLDRVWSSRVTLMTFSEFGRTAWSNDSAGTDHGTANCALVLGSNVKGGMYGEAPSLVSLDRWERMVPTVDHRSYYASVLDGWMGGGSSTVLGGTYEDLGLFRGPPGTPAAAPVLS